MRPAVTGRDTVNVPVVFMVKVSVMVNDAVLLTLKEFAPSKLRLKIVWLPVLNTIVLVPGRLIKTTSVAVGKTSVFQLRGLLHKKLPALLSKQTPAQDEVLFNA